MWIILVALLGAGRPAYHVFVTGEPGAVLGRALDAARSRLATSPCERLLSDFTDHDGRPLAERVAAEGKPAAAILAALYFVDGDDTPQCRTDDGIAAFTEVGSRVVHVCSKRIARFAANPASIERLLIHELLHALGLGENPPSSGQIATAVFERCGP